MEEGAGSVKLEPSRRPLTISLPDRDESPLEFLTFDHEASEANACGGASRLGPAHHGAAGRAPGGAAAQLAAGQIEDAPIDLRGTRQIDRERHRTVARIGEGIREG